MKFSNNASTRNTLQIIEIWYFQFKHSSIWTPKIIIFYGLWYRMPFVDQYILQKHFFSSSLYIKLLNKSYNAIDVDYLAQKPYWLEDSMLYLLRKLLKSIKHTFFKDFIRSRENWNQPVISKFIFIIIFKNGT